MRTAQASLEQGIGSANAIAGVHFASCPGGNTYEGNGGHVPGAGGWLSEVQFNAHGMQVNGQRLGGKTSGSSHSITKGTAEAY